MRRRGFIVRLLLLSLLLPTLATDAFAAAPPLSKGQRALLEKGEVIVKSLEPTGGEGVSARVIGIVEAPPKKVFEVIDDCARFKEFMPRTKDSALRKQLEDAKICYVEISMPFPISNLTSEVFSVSKALPGGAFERNWRLLKGTYKRNSGSWTVYPLDEGARSLVVYFLDVNPKIMIPDAIIRSAQTGSLPDVYEAIRKRVKAL